MRLPWRKSPCTSVTSSGGPGSWSRQPAQRQFEHRPRPVEARGAHARARRFPCSTSSRAMPATSRAAGRGCRPRCCRAGAPAAAAPRELLIAQDLARDGLALDPLHDEAGAEIILRPQHMQHARRRHAGLESEPHQDRLVFEARRARRRGAIPLRRAAQDGADVAVGMQRCRSSRFPGWHRRRVSLAPVTPVAPGHHDATQRQSSASIIGP